MAALSDIHNSEEPPSPQSPAHKQQNLEASSSDSREYTSTHGCNDGATGTGGLEMASNLANASKATQGLQLHDVRFSSAVSNLRRNSQSSHQVPPRRTKALLRRLNT